MVLEITVAKLARLVFGAEIEPSYSFEATAFLILKPAQTKSLGFGIGAAQFL